MHHFPHILPTPLSLSNTTKPVNQSVGVYLSCLTQQFLSTAPLVHRYGLRPSEFTLPPSAMLSTRSTLQSRATSSTLVTHEDIPEEILAPLLFAATNFLNSTMPPPTPCANPPLLSNCNQEIAHGVPRSSGNSIYEVDTVTNSPSPPPFHKI